MNNRDTSILIKYGTIIKKIRKKYGMSQFALECQAGFSYGSLSRIENGQVNPTKETLFKIASVLKLNRDEVIELFGI